MGENFRGLSKNTELAHGAKFCVILLFLKKMLAKPERWQEQWIQVGMMFGDLIKRIFDDCDVDHVKLVCLKFLCFQIF